MLPIERLPSYSKQFYLILLFSLSRFAFLLNVPRIAVQYVKIDNDTVVGFTFKEKGFNEIVYGTDFLA